MRCYISPSANPYFNLAAEEYFLKNSTEEFFMLYINEPSVVVGKHQNLLAEINLPVIHENNIHLARRISGGGTVYQDFGNLNFSFIHQCEQRDQINFQHFTQPILTALREMGLDVQFSGRNDLLINNLKISGNAMHIYKNRALSHGTILFNADLATLSAALKTREGAYDDRAIKSVRSKVTNIQSLFKQPVTLEQFKQQLFDRIVSTRQKSRILLPQPEENNQIELLAETKFKTAEWLFGYSPRYRFTNRILLTDNVEIEVGFQVEKGIIRDIQLDTNNRNVESYEILIKSLINSPHRYDAILDRFEKSNLTGLNRKKLCSQLF